jgi:hypothetical protein
MMISRTTIRGVGLLLALAGANLTVAQAQQTTDAEVTANDQASNDQASNDQASEAKSDLPEPDWSVLNESGTLGDKLATKIRESRRLAVDAAAAWSEQGKSNGTAAVSVKQPLSTFWDARIGADMNVVNQSSTLTSADLLRQKYAPDAQPSQSTGTAWAAVTAPGIGSIWDQTAIEARVDPSQDQGKLGTSMSKSLPLADEQYSLTLQNGYDMTQQNLAPAVGISGRPARNYQTEQSAKLSIADTGTSFVAGQSLSSTDDKWLRKIGAEQKLFGDINVSGSISETTQGATNRSITAGFKHSW